MLLRLHILVLSLTLVSTSVYSQWVKEDDTTRLWLDDGIYLSDTSFFRNQPDLVWAEFTDQNWRKKDSLDRSRILTGIAITDYYNGNIRLKVASVYGINSQEEPEIIERGKVFGIVVMGTPYLQIDEAENENFIRVIMQGVISQINYHRRIEDPFSVTSGNFYNEPRPAKEYVEKIVDFENEEIIVKNKRNLELILQRNKELYQQYITGKTNYTNLIKYIKYYNESTQFGFK